MDHGDLSAWAIHEIIQLLLFENVILIHLFLIGDVFWNDQVNHQLKKEFLCEIRFLINSVERRVPKRIGGNGSQIYLPFMCNFNEDTAKQS